MENCALNGSLVDFARVRGADLLARTQSLHDWISVRRQARTWPYTRALQGATGPSASISFETGEMGSGRNFASQDYLSLSRHPRVAQAVCDAVRAHGVHSAGSAALLGNTQASLQLEDALSEFLGGGHVVLFPTGWGAGYGVVTALVRPFDHIVMDQLAHACLQSGAAAATRQVVSTPHLDVSAMIEAIRAIRAEDDRNGILVITESLFSMDSDTQRLRQLQDACREWGATLLVDMAHDLGALGPGGTGHLGIQGMLGEVDLVMGAFSKTFASNGGFVLCPSASVRDQLRCFGGPYTFSNALSPLQAAAVTEALGIVRGPEGEVRRQSLLANAKALRERFASHGIQCLGEPSAIVPVPVGPEAVGRLASWMLFERGLLLNLVEFPAVRKGAARFRMQLMSDHIASDMADAADLVVDCLKAARAHLASTQPELLGGVA